MRTETVAADRSSEALISSVRYPACFATTWASVVFPYPGGPDSKRIRSRGRPRGSFCCQLRSTSCELTLTHSPSTALRFFGGIRLNTHLSHSFNHAMTSRCTRCCQLFTAFLTHIFSEQVRELFRPILVDPHRLRDALALITGDDVDLAVDSGVSYPDSRCSLTVEPSRGLSSPQPHAGGGAAAWTRGSACLEVSAPVVS